MIRSRPDRYAVLQDVQATMTNFDHPGYSNAATHEIYSKGIITSMFAKVATGAASAEDALSEADVHVRSIFEKWITAGKI